MGILSALGLAKQRELEDYQIQVIEKDGELKRLQNNQTEIIANVITSYQSALYGYLNNGQPVQLADNTFTYIEQGYQHNADVYACIDLILTKLSACTPLVYEVTKDKLGNVQKYRNLIQSNTDESRIKAKAIEIKAMKEVYMPEISDLLYKPNPYQTYGEWIKHYAGFYLLTGNTYNYYNYLNPKVRKPREMFVLPSQFIQIMSGGAFEPIAGYRIINQRFFGSSQFDFSKDDVSHLKTFNPNYTNYGSQLYGQSPLMAYRLTLQKNRDSRLEANKQMKNGGAMGILAPKQGAPSLTPDQARDLKEQIASKHRSSGDLIERIFASGAALDWTQIGLPVGDMMLMESLAFDRVDIANCYHVPITLLNNMDASTDNNVSAHMKQFIYNAIIPLANLISDRLTRDICSAYATNGKTYVIQLDASTLPDMQEDQGKVAAWLEQAWWLTGNQKLTAQGFGESQEPLMNKIVLPSSFRLLSDLEMGTADFTNAGDPNAVL